MTSWYWIRVQGWGLLSQFPPFHYFPKFSALSKHTLAIEYHVYIWQVSQQLSSNNLRCTFDRSKILLTEKLTNEALVTPTPGLLHCNQWQQSYCHNVITASALITNMINGKLNGLCSVHATPHQLMGFFAFFTFSPPEAQWQLTLGNNPLTRTRVEEGNASPCPCRMHSLKVLLTSVI